VPHTCSPLRNNDVHFYTSAVFIMFVHFLYCSEFLPVFYAVFKYAVVSMFKFQ